MIKIGLNDKITLSSDYALDLKMVFDIDDDFTKILLSNNQTDYANATIVFDNNNAIYRNNQQTVVFDRDKIEIGDIKQIDHSLFVTIGRNADNKVVINNSNFSRYQCKIRMLTPVMIELEDLGSTKCQAPYKIDETKITTTQAVVVCTQCGAKNILCMGPVLVAQSKEKVQQFSLKEGINILGRQSKTPQADFLIDDEYISRKHAAINIENRDNKVFISIEDKSSLNGTFNKNKVRLKPGLKYPFMPNDYIIIGLTKLTLKIN